MDTIIFHFCESEHETKDVHVDILKTLSQKMPGKESLFDDWKTYNESQYKILIIPEATAEEKKAAMQNLLVANRALFVKRAKTETVLSCGFDREDILQIEMMNFIEVIKEASEAGIEEFPAARAFDQYDYKRDLWKGYAPCGIKMSYSTKKRQVQNNKFDMQRVSYVDEFCQSEQSRKGNISANHTGHNAKSKEMRDQDLFQNVWKDELHTSLDAVMAGLTELEANLLILKAEGLSNVRIAKELGISESSVRRYLPHVIKKARKLATEWGLDSYYQDLWS